MKISTLKLAIFVSIITAFPSGCSSLMPASPLQIEQPLKFETAASRALVEEILVDVLAESHDASPFVSYLPTTTRSYVPHRGLEISYHGGTNADFSYQLAVSPRKELEITNLSEERHNNNVGDAAYCLLCSDNGFTEYAEELILSVYEKVKSRLDIYDINNRKFQYEISEKAPRYVESMTLEIVTSDVLSQDAFNYFNHPEIRLSHPQRLPKIYSEQIAHTMPIEISASFRGCQKSNCRFEQYRNVQLSNGYYDGHYMSAPETLIATVISADFNLMPSDFTAQDSSLQIEFSYPNIKLINNSSQFLRVQDISIYAGKKIDTENTDISLPPSAEQNFRLSKIRNVPTRMTKRLAAEQTISESFGVAINYKVGSEEHTLFKQEVFSKVP